MTETRGPAARWWSRPEFLAAAVLLAVAAVAWIASRDLAAGTLSRPGPGFFPRGLTLLLAGLTAVLLLRGIRLPTASLGSLWPDQAGAGRVVTLALLLGAYVALVEAAGYLLTTALFFVVMLRGLGRQGWIVTAVVSLAAVAGSYLLFARWLLVNLPRGALLP